VPVPSRHKNDTEETQLQDVVQILPAPKSSLQKTPRNTRDVQPLSPKASATAVEATRASVGPPSQHVTAPNTEELASVAAASTTPASLTLPPKPSASPDNIPTQRGPLGQVQAQSLSSAPALPLQRFFDLGRFKQQAAQDLSERVAQLGMRSSVVNRGHFWMSSYQVLVGPYLTEAEESKIHSGLVSNGIKARPFERGSRGFAFRSALTVGGSKLPVGDLNISWETYISEAKVKFTQDGVVLASADASWVPRQQKFAHNEYVYQNLGGNSRPLLEVHFAGLERALVFR